MDKAQLKVCVNASLVFCMLPKGDELKDLVYISLEEESDFKRGLFITIFLRDDTK